MKIVAKERPDEQMNNTFQELTNNLEAMLHESMVKIGYVKGQPVGIYYTKDLMHHLLGLEKCSMEEKELSNHHNQSNRKEILEKHALQQLEQFTREKEPEWGNILCELQKDRYKLTVPAKGMEYVYKKNKDNHFLEDLIGVLRYPDVTIENVIAVFHKYSDQVICEKSEDEEFEYAVRFADSSIDPFVYCFTFDEMGKYYHRFTEYDYRKLREG
ncbi:MAG: hypothetical protein E7255_09400 [Lachnospiraceae bacterium]|nr:hypothetical protein [Lachnospiraceae bacterium]